MLYDEISLTQIVASGEVVRVCVGLSRDTGYQTIPRLRIRRNDDTYGREASEVDFTNILGVEVGYCSRAHSLFLVLRLIVCVQQV